MTHRNLQEIRWQLAQRRAERIYAKSPDAGLSFGPIKLGIADDNLWAHEKGVFVFQFGAYGTTHVLAYGVLRDALEDAAAWLKDNAPGHLTEPDYEDARADLARDGKLVGSYCVPLTDEEIEDKVRDHAEEDLTYTESGWLLSHEWTITELHDPSELLAYVARK